MQDRIRNFAIIAHVDHGKSTLADRLLELTGTVQKRDMAEQLLDSNPIERERGITIKLAPARMIYSLSGHPGDPPVGGDSRILLGSWTSQNDESYVLNLIDTPGHVDFSYEVSRSLAACEGALLVVDATQGVQAQTLAHLHQARTGNLVIIPIINKIDLPNARIEETKEELLALGFKDEEMLEISAKTGKNVEQVLEAVVEHIPPPQGGASAPLRALVFSSQYDLHKGVVVFVRVVDGSLLRSEASAGAAIQRITFMASGAQVTPIEVGYFTPRMHASSGLVTGEVGYIATGLKDVRFAKVGDTITTPDVIARSEATRQSLTKNEIALPSERTRNDKIAPLEGYKEPKPMVFVGLFPVDSAELTLAREAMEKLRLSDSAFTFRPISSLALGNGFHCGFLGLLHAEIVQERLLREFGLTMIATAPSVEYHICLKDSRNLASDSGNQYIKVIQSVSEFPDPSLIEKVREPVMQVAIFAPKRFVGSIMQLAQEKRGTYVDLHYLTSEVSKSSTSEVKEGIAEFTYLIPLSEMIVDFFDRLKSATEGYASLDYEFYEYQPVNVVKLDVLVNKEKVDAFSVLVVESQAQFYGRDLVERLAGAIPRQQFQIPVQAAIGGQVIARADVKAFRKDVIQKLYGGDRSRKDKLLDKQKKGKAKMKMIGRVEIPQSAFFAVLKRT